MGRFVDPDWMTQTELDESTGEGFETLGAPLCTGVIRAVIITTEGHIEDIQLPFWRGNRAQEAFDTGQATVGIGPPIYRPDLCERVLYKRTATGRVAYSRKDVEAWLATLKARSPEGESAAVTEAPAAVQGESPSARGNGAAARQETEKAPVEEAPAAVLDNLNGLEAGLPKPSRSSRRKTRLEALDARARSAACAWSMMRLIAVSPTTPLHGDPKEKPQTFSANG
jgi:hypothetical protein